MGEGLDQHDSLSKLDTADASGRWSPFPNAKDSGLDSRHSLPRMLVVVIIDSIVEATGWVSIRMQQGAPLGRQDWRMSPVREERTRSASAR